MKNKSGNTVFIITGLAVLIGLVLQFLDLLRKISQSIEMYGALTETALGRAVVPYVVLALVVVLSIVVTAAVAYRSPHLGENQERSQLSNLEATSGALSKKD